MCGALARSLTLSLNTKDFTVIQLLIYLKICDNDLIVVN